MSDLTTMPPVLQPRFQMSHIPGSSNQLGSHHHIHSRNHWSAPLKTGCPCWHETSLKEAGGVDDSTGQLTVSSLLIFCSLLGVMLAIRAETDLASLADGGSHHGSLWGFGMHCADILAVIPNHEVCQGSPASPRGV